MARTDTIIELHPWLATVAGRYLQAWEQAQADRALANTFGFHALQLGLPELDTLRANRMPHRWVALDGSYSGWPAPGAIDALSGGGARVAVRCDFDALPFPNHSMDLVVLPHALELAQDPHQTLREVERVLVPDGRVAIFGFNPASLWGLVQRFPAIGGGHRTFVMPDGEFIGYWRLRDWLRLLGLEVETGCFGCYRPAVRSESWLNRLEWMDRWGDRWWPVLGGAYFIVATKRMRGMRLVGKLRGMRAAPVPAPAAVTNKHESRIE